MWTSIFFCVFVQFCGYVDEVCERLVCRLGNLEPGREAVIQLEIKLNPAVLLQAPVKTQITFTQNCAWTHHVQTDGAAALTVKASISSAN